MVESMPNFPGYIGRRQRIMGLGFGLLILVFGVIIGAGGMFLLLKDRLIKQTTPPIDRIQEMVREMHDKLNLTDQQEKQIHSLFEERFKAMGEIFKGLGEKQKQEWELTLSGMKSILTEEQFTTWKKDMEERRKRFERERGPRGQGGPGRGGPDGQRGPGGPDRPDGRRDRPNQGDRPQQGPPPGGPMPGGTMPGGPMPGGPGPGGPGPGHDQPEKPMTPPPGTPMPDQAPKPAEPAAPPAGSTTPPTTPEEPKPL